MSEQKVIFSGCGHELERVIADMSCPVCARKEIERLTAECAHRGELLDRHTRKIVRLQARVEKLKLKYLKLEGDHQQHFNHGWDAGFSAGIERLTAGLLVESKLRQQYHLERDALQARVEALELAAGRVCESWMNGNVDCDLAGNMADLIAATEQGDE